MPSGDTRQGAKKFSGWREMAAPMIFEDATGRFAKAAECLLHRNEMARPGQMRIQPLNRFLQSASVSKLARGEREDICDQAILLLEQFYPHLRFKRVRYAIDPVQRLRLLRARAAHVSELRFHCEILRIFAELRDVHTFYRLPEPFRQAMAFLPFFVQAHGADNAQRFLVTHILEEFEGAALGFTRGVEITHWNGVPMARAVELLAEHIPGGNPAAKLIRARMSMTLRSLGVGLPPDEEMVFVQYRAAGRNEERVMRVPWYVGTGMIGDWIRADGAGICEPLADGAKARKLLWSRHDAPDTHDAPAASAASLLPHVFAFANIAGAAGKRFGYLRIKTFEAGETEIVEEFDRLLRLMRDSAPDGLILDVRANPGGSVQAAERLLQMLTPKEIETAPFHFANTPLMQDVLEGLQAARRRAPLQKLEQVETTAVLFEDWFGEKMDEAASGNPITDGHPVTAKEHANDRGQIYQGPVTLLTDASSYSATDIFAAGFQDHGIGTIMGTDANTGGGGAVRWLHRNQLIDGLKKTLPRLPLKPLPEGADMGVALQRSTRVGPNSGRPVEDLGVQSDLRHVLTKNDLLNGSVDLMSAACAHLEKQPVRSLRILSAVLLGEAVEVTVSTQGVDRLVCYLDGHAQWAVSAARQAFSMPIERCAQPSPKLLTVLGYAGRDLAASARAALADEAASAAIASV